MVLSFGIWFDRYLEFYGEDRGCLDAVTVVAVLTSSDGGGGGGSSGGLDNDLPQLGGSIPAVGGPGGGGSTSGNPSPSPDSNAGNSGTSETSTTLESAYWQEGTAANTGMVTTLASAIGLTATEAQWLQNTQNNTAQQMLLFQFIHFLDQNHWSFEAKNFAKEAIGVLMDDGGNFSEMVASFENINIDQSLKDTCAESIIIDFILKDFSNPFNNNPLINRTFDKLSSQPSDINIIYKAENIGGNGTTLPAQLNSSTGKWDIVVKIDTDLISNGTQIAVAKTILHESIHAYLRYLQKQNPTVFHTNSDFTDLVAAFQVYSDNSYAQHVYMAGLIQEMGQQLSDYAINNLNYPDTGSSYPSGSISEFYEAISWSGIALIDDPTTNTLGAYIYNPVFLQNYTQASDQQQIIDNFTAENTGQNSNNTTPLINNSCN